MKWELAIVAATLLGVAGVSRRLTDTSFTPAMAFVLIGLLVGPLIIDQVDLAPTSATLRTFAEATLAVVLFADASRIKLRVLEREYAVPLRLLAVGLPLTIVVGAVLAAMIFAHLNGAEAVVLAVLLAPTDAALGQAVVTEPRLPSRIRQGLNVESGLNDGICVPLLLIALAIADVEDKTASTGHAISIVAEEIGYGILGGLAAGLIAAAVVAVGSRRRLISGPWLQVIPVAGAGLAYGIAVALGGSGFIAAFLAGGVFGALVPRKSEQASRLNEELGALLGGVTFLIFGAVLLGPTLKHLTWQAVLYAVLSLTLIRMLPVAIAMVRSGANWRTVGFVGWFGPRGLASIVFAVITVQEAHLAGSDTILLTTYLAIGLSVLLHGVTAAPLARRYAHWYETHPPIGARRWKAFLPQITVRVGGGTEPREKARSPSPRWDDDSLTGQCDRSRMVNTNLPTERRERLEDFVSLLRVKPGSRVRLAKDFDPAFKAGVDRKKDGVALLEEGVQLMSEYQARLAAQDTWGVLVVLQALDAAGKDGTIRHVMSGVNPQGVSVHSFKVPSAEELDHDYLWRYAQRLPARGEIGIFNRSYYEEVLVVRVHPEILDRQKLPAARQEARHLEAALPRDQRLGALPDRQRASGS